MTKMWLGFGFLGAVAAIETIRRVPRLDSPQSLLEVELSSESPKPVAMAESLIALAMADADTGSAAGNQALGNELSRKAQSAMQEMRKRVESDRHKMWKSLKDAYHAIENCLMDQDPKVASLLADGKVEDNAVEAAQSEMQMMADLDKMASDHRSCRMEEDSAFAATMGCQAANGGKVCIPVNEAHQTQKKICDDAQILLEKKACQVASKSKACDERMKCHAEQTKAYEAAREAAEKNEKELRREEHALVQIECILTSSPGSFENCKDLLRTPRFATVTASGSLLEDASAMLAEFPKPPAAKACLASDEARSLLMSFFVGLPQGAPALACSSDCCMDNV